MRLLLPCLAAIFTLGSAASAQETPREAVDTLFEGMRTGNGGLVRGVVQPGARLSRIEEDGTVTASSFEDWAEWIDTQEKGAADEQIFAVTTHEYGNLASVWAPFTLTYQGSIAGCGVNHFTLALMGQGWTVIHGVDTQDDGDCTTFKARYEAQNE